MRIYYDITLSNCALLRHGAASQSNKISTNQHRIVTLKRVKKNGRTQWRLSYQDAGTQRRKFFDTKSEAQQFADTLTAKDSAFLRWMALDESARMDALISAERAGAMGFTLIEAVDHYKRKAGVLDINTGKAWAEFLHIKKAVRGIGDQSLRNANVAGRFLGNYADQPVGEITSSKIEQWISSHDWAPSSVNTFRTQLGGFLNWCVSKDYLIKSPLMAVPKALETETDVGILSIDQAIALMQACVDHDPELIPIAALGLFCGLRPSECHRLNWSQINLEQGIITMTGATARKTRKSRIIHMERNAIAWLKLGGELQPKNFRRRWDIVREHAKLVQRIRIDGQKRYVLEEIHWPQDCLRHSFASYYTPLHGMAAAALECGNSEQVQIKHYRFPVAKAECRKFFDIMPAKQTAGARSNT